PATRLLGHLQGLVLGADVARDCQGGRGLVVYHVRKAHVERSQPVPALLARRGADERGIDATAEESAEWHVTLQLARDGLFNKLIGRINGLSEREVGPRNERPAVVGAMLDIHVGVAAEVRLEQRSGLER